MRNTFSCRAPLFSRAKYLQIVLKAWKQNKCFGYKQLEICVLHVLSSAILQDGSRQNITKTIVTFVQKQQAAFGRSALLALRIAYLHLVQSFPGQDEEFFKVLRFSGLARGFSRRCRKSREQSANSAKRMPGGSSSCVSPCLTK